MIYRVKEGKHHYTPNRLALWSMGRGNNELELYADVIFRVDTMAPPADHPLNERLQINKLTGFSWMWRMRNKHSVRIGWRIDLEDEDKVEWFLYVRDKGVLLWYPVGKTTKTVKTELRLKITRQHTAELYVKQRDGMDVIVESRSIDFRFPQYYGYVAEPYYGGRAAAPTDMALSLTQTLFSS